MGGRGRACDNGSMTERIEVQRPIAAEPEAIFELLTDPAGHVVIDSSGMLMAASGDRVGAVGDTFVVHMDREALNDHPLGLYDVTVKIVTYAPDREIAWTVEGQLNLGHVYGYQLEAIEQGTLVTSYYDWSAVASKRGKTAGSFLSSPKRRSAPLSGSSLELLLRDGHVPKADYRSAGVELSSLPTRVFVAPRARALSSWFGLRTSSSLPMAHGAHRFRVR